ncbi:putative membrane protein [Pseudomonas syringae]|uniref:hypothetical protein n=1 Tax=Pseudomonas syringae TaxID=317 RepID=UPI001CA9C8A1|nr:hypothetical protein [Pseudomonas syringae]MCI3945348.1 putative membrane protein [Pseudomonas syringae]
MCRSKEPIAGVFLLLVLAAGGLVAQEPFPHFGIDLPSDMLNGESPPRPVSQRQTMPLDERRFSSVMLESANLYAVLEQPAQL